MYCNVLIVVLDGLMPLPGQYAYIMIVIFSRDWETKLLVLVVCYECAGVYNGSQRGPIIRVWSRVLLSPVWSRGKAPQGSRTRDVKREPENR